MDLIFPPIYRNLNYPAKSPAVPAEKMCAEGSSYAVNIGGPFYVVSYKRMDCL
jgi:hypothetical protein